MNEINKLCRHPKLLARWNVSKGKAIVQCANPECRFSVEITGDNLDESTLRAEFNLAAQKATIGQRIFPVSN